MKKLVEKLRIILVEELPMGMWGSYDLDPDELALTIIKRLKEK